MGYLTATLKGFFSEYKGAGKPTPAALFDDQDGHAWPGERLESHTRKSRKYKPLKRRLAKTHCRTQPIENRERRRSAHDKPCTKWSETAVLKLFK